MAEVTPVCIKKTRQEAVFKVSGSSGDTAEITVQDLVLSTQEELNEAATDLFTIVGVGVTGVPGSIIVITRTATGDGDDDVMTFAPENNGYLDMSGQMLPPNNINSDGDTITIDFADTGLVTEYTPISACCWIKIRKSAGAFAPLVGRYAAMGSYEDDDYTTNS